MTKSRDTADINSGTNTAVGEDALESNTASNNTAVGYGALTRNTSGTRNVGIGHTSLNFNTTASYNTALGFRGLFSNTTGASNVGLGYQALDTNTSGSNNVAIGRDALVLNTTASNNTAVGYQAAYSITGSQANTAIGRGALYSHTTGNGANVALGYDSSRSLTTGAYNVSVGTNALYSNTTASYNTAVGYKAGYSNTTGTNDAFGTFALLQNTTGTKNVAIGKNSLENNTTASDNTAVGYQAGYNNTTGTYNTFVGKDAGLTNTTASNSSYFGEFSGRLATGNSNTFYGQQSGHTVTTGSKNTILGRYTGNQGGLDIRTLSNRIVLSDGDGNPRHYVNASGDQAFSTVDMTTSNGSVGRVYAYEAPSNNLCNIYHLNSASHQVIFEARRNGRTNERMSQINIGENGSSQGEVTIFSSTANANLSGGVVVANGATSWSSASDTRLKNITGTYDNALQDIANIEPIKFTWKSDSTNQPNVGVSAQSVQAVVPEAVDARKNLLTPDDETEYLSVKYTELIPLMIASIQELSAKNDALEARIATLEEG